MQTKVKKWGNSLAVRIPGSYIKDHGITDGTGVNISMNNDSMVLKFVKISKLTYSLKTLLKGVNETNIHQEIETGEIIGEESW